MDEMARSGMTRLRFLLISLTLWTSLCMSISAASKPDIRATSNRQYPLGKAEQMIKALNLLPEDAPFDFDDDGAGGTQLIETNLKLNVSGESGSTGASADGGLGQYAGYFKLPRTHAAKMFYFFFESRANKTGDPLLLWMTGGPGCGSELALFYENGPFTIAEDLSLVWNAHGWDQASSIIFVDQPIGSGFSYSSDKRDYRHDEEGSSEDLIDFFQAFFAAHPEYSGNDLFIFGESYGGHFAPAAASHIHRYNKKSEGPHINLKGFAIGNGVTQPDIQYESLPEYAHEKGLIGAEECKRLSSTMYPACAASLKLCQSGETAACIAAYSDCTSILDSILKISGNINAYDIRKESLGDLGYNVSNLEAFLNQQSVRKELGVGHRRYVVCNDMVKEAMIAAYMRNFELGIPELLEDGIKVFVYAGEYDLKWNWIGASRWVTTMDWSGHEEYAKAEWKSFDVEGETKGLFTSYGPLTFLKVYNAGHWVPMDQPQGSLEMLLRWTRGKSLENGAELA